MQTRPPDSGAAAAHDSKWIECISSLGLGADFRWIRFISFGPGADSDASTEYKVLGLEPALDSLDAFACTRFRGPGGPWGGTWI